MQRGLLVAGHCVFFNFICAISFILYAWLCLAKRMTVKLDMVSKMDRSELEDKFIRMYEENLIIKRYAKKQDDKIKKSVKSCICLSQSMLRD